MWRGVALPAARRAGRHFKAANFCALLVHDGAEMIAPRASKCLLEGGRPATVRSDSAE